MSGKGHSSFSLDTFLLQGQNNSSIKNNVQCTRLFSPFKQTSHPWIFIFHKIKIPSAISGVEKNNKLQKMKQESLKQK